MRSEGTTEAAAETDAADYPVCDFMHLGVEPALTFVERLDALRRQAPMVRSSITGMWVPTRMDGIREAFQRYDLFSSEWSQDKVPSFLNIDPPLHTKYRQVLSPLFAPSRVKKLEAEARTWCSELVDRIAPRGQCDFVADFAAKFPSAIFLGLMGLPQSDLDQLLAWERAILHTHDRESDPDGAIEARAWREVREYLADVVRARSQEPTDDFVGHLVRAEIDGEPITFEAAVATCVVLFLGGLDTVTSELAYAFLHLATHPSDRQRVATEPEIVPNAIEELLRAYPIVMTRRLVTRDAEFLGCPVAQGDTVLLPTTSANRDESVFEDATTVKLDREGNAHITFGAGPHRCIGSHLARMEMRVAMEEWHRRIPDYRLPEGVELKEHGYILGLLDLPLVWSPAGERA